MAEVSEIRKRLRHAIAKAREEASAHRALVDAAERDFGRFLEEVAAPAFRQFAGVLRAEGCPFHIATPAGGVRLESDRARDDFIELSLDTSGPPVVIGRTSRGRGRRVVADERVLCDGAAVAALTEEDVLAFLLTVVPSLVER